jgi:DNA-binding winged helix-turn-helix (wHTH) protein
MLERFEGRIDELESVVRELAIEITTGTVVDRIPSDEVWAKTGERVTVVRELIKELREYLYIIKPHKVPTIQGKATGIFERLDIFKESLTQESAEEANAKSSIEELRKALEEIAEFTSLCREIQDDPSEIIQTILQLRESQQTDRPPMTPAKMMKRPGDPREDSRACGSARWGAGRSQGGVRRTIFQPQQERRRVKSSPSSFSDSVGVSLGRLV